MSLSGAAVDPWDRKNEITGGFNAFGHADKNKGVTSWFFNSSESTGVNVSSMLNWWLSGSESYSDRSGEQPDADVEQIVNDFVPRRDVQIEADKRILLLAKKYGNSTSALFQREDDARLKIIESKLNNMVEGYSKSEWKSLEAFVDQIDRLSDALSENQHRIDE